MKGEPPDLRTVGRSLRAGARGLVFPTLEDYLRLVSAAGFNRDGLATQPDLVVRIQSHWHQTGQNGCRFAQLLSKSPAEYGWKVVVATGAAESHADEDILKRIERQVLEASDVEGVYALSFIFPDVVAPNQLTQLLVNLSRLRGWRLDEIDEPLETDSGGILVRLGLRVLLGRTGVRSWGLGFGQFDFLPLTRRAPFTEIALATKPKILPVRFEKLNRNPMLAHLADVPVLALTDEAFAKLWGRTVSNKADILHGAHEHARAAAKARVTFVVPRAEWDAVWTNG